MISIEKNCIGLKNYWSKYLNFEYWTASSELNSDEDMPLFSLLRIQFDTFLRIFRPQKVMAKKLTIRSVVKPILPSLNAGSKKFI